MNGAAAMLALAAEHLPAALLPMREAAALGEVAERVAPLRQLYFEFRLAGPDERVDVSQHFFGATDGGQALARLAEARLAAGGAGAWRRIGDFAVAWQDDPALSDAIAEIGLEIDMLPDGGWSDPPAIFAAFPDDVLADAAAARRFAATVAPDAGAAMDRLLALLETARAHGLKAGRLVGAMLSRDAELRCMVKGLPGGDVPAFLKAADWPGDHDALLELLAEPVFASDATRLVFGFGPELAAGCGIEIIHPIDGEGPAEQLKALRWLAGTGLAERDRVAAISGWRGDIHPGNARSRWPDSLILRDLARAERTRFLTFISHVKINIGPDGPLPAKAYASMVPHIEPADA